MDVSQLPGDLRDCIAFHGHYCGGLLIGYRAAKAAMERIGARRSVDEELVAIVENDSCAADAVQVLTGCTFGKGNFVYRDHGKHVYTFALRPSGRAVRVSRRTRDEIDQPEPDPALTGQERTDSHLQWMLAAPADRLFRIEDLTIHLPETAVIRDSVMCDACGEPVMQTRTRRLDGRTLYIPCAEAGREPDDGSAR